VCNILVEKGSEGPRPKKVTEGPGRLRYATAHLTYLMQLPYLGKSQNTKNDQFRRKQHIVLWINNVKRYFIYT